VRRRKIVVPPLDDSLLEVPTMKFRSFLRFLDFRWFRGFKLRPTRPINKRGRRTSLELETLETRVVPSTAPTIVKTLTAPADGSTVSTATPTIQVVFSEKMNSIAASNPNNYFLFGSSGNSITVNSVTLNGPDSSGNETATLNYNGGQGLILDTYTLFVRADQLTADTSVGGLPIAPPGQIAVANSGSNNVSYIALPGDGSLGAISEYSLTTSGSASIATPVAAAAGVLTGTGGLPDLVVVDSVNAQVDIFAGQPASSGGGFNIIPDLVLTLPSGAANKAHSVALGDFNKDGNLDIAVANYGTSNVTVFLNTTSAGNLSFGPGTNYTGGSLLFGPTALVAGDFDADGSVDLAVVNNTADASSNYNLVILPGNGSGSFGNGTAITLGSTSGNLEGLRYIAAGQLDADKSNLPDLVVAADTNGADYLINTTTGAGKFSFAASALTSTTLSDVAIGLLRVPGTGDNPKQLDIVGLDSGNKQVDIWQNSGNSSIGTANFSTLSPITVGTNPQGLALAPLVAGDARNGILVTQNNAAGSLTVIQNNSTIGSTSFSIALNSPYSTDKNPVAVIAADFSGDTDSSNNNLQQVVVLNNTSGDFTLLEGVGDGTLVANGNVALGPTVTTSVASGDLNGDGIPDLVVVNNNNSSNNTFVSVLLGQSGGGYAAPINFSPSSSGSNIRNVVSVAVGDVTGDSKPDIIVADQTDSTVAVLKNNISSSTASLGVGSFIAESAFSVGGGPTQLVLGDFNNDGKLDLAVAHKGTSGGGFGHHGGSPGGVSILLGNGDTNGTFGKATEYDTNQPAAAIAVGDLNNDGKLDFVVANAASGGGFGGNSGTIAVYYGDGTGKFKSPSGTVNPGVTNPDSVAIADFNADGYADIVVASSSTATTNAGVAVLLNQLGTGFGQPLITTVLPGSSLQTVSVAHIDNDAFPDLIVTTTPIKNAFNQDNVYTLLGNGDGTFQRAIPYQVGGTGSTTLGPSYAAIISDPFLRVTTFNSGGTQVRPNLVANGNFETRDLTGTAGILTGWQQYELPDNPGGSHGAWSIQTGTTSPLSGASVTPPTGTFQAMLDEANLVPVTNNNNPNSAASYAGTTAFYQDITIPSTATQVTLSMTLSLYNSATAWSDTSTPLILDYRNPNPDQQVRVDIMDPNATGFSILGIDNASGLLKNVYLSNDSTALTTTVSLKNISLAAFAGKTIMLRVATTNNQGKLIVGVDNVQLNALFSDTIAPTLSNISLRNAGFVDPSTGTVTHTTDSTIIGHVSDMGGVNNISYVEIDPGNTSFAGTGIVKITNLDPNGNFTFTLPNPSPGLNTINIAAVNKANNVSAITTFTYFYQGPSLTDWQAFGPNTIDTTGLPGINYSNISGNVTDVAVDPTDPTGNTYYIGSDNGGVWKTTDGGNDWAPLTDYVTDQNGSPIPVPVGALAVSKTVDTATNTHVIYVGTGVANDNLDSRTGFGVLMSTDGGQTWAVDGNSGTALAGATISSVVVDNNDPNIVYVAVASGGANGPGVYKSTNALDTVNATWNIVTSDSVMFSGGGTLSGVSLASATSLIEDPFNSNRLILGLGNVGLTSASSSAGVWLSINKGASWTLQTGGSGSVSNSSLASGSSVGRVTVAMGSGRVGDEANVYVLMGTPPTNIATAPNFSYGSEYNSGANGSGLYYSPNNMLNFTEVMLNVNISGQGTPQAFAPLNLLGNNAANAGALLVDPTNPHAVFVGGSTRGVGSPSNQNQSFVRVDVGNIDGISGGNTGDDTTKRSNSGNYYDPPTDSDLYGSYSSGVSVNGEGVYWYNLAQAASSNSGKVQLLPPNINALALDSQGRLIIATDQGVWRGISQGYGYDFTSGGQGIIRAGKGQQQFSTPGMALTAINGNLQISDLTSVAIDPTTRNVLYTTQYLSGTAGSSGVLNWSSEGLTGPTVNGKNLGVNTASQVLISQPPAGAPAGTPNTLYRVWEFAASGAVVPEVSADSGASFNSLNSTGIPTTINAGTFPAFVIDPVQIFDSGLFEDELLFGTTNTVYITRTSSNVWDALPSLSNTSGYISALAISQSTDGVFYAGTSLGQLFLTTNSGGDNWPEIDSGLPTNVRITSITVDPSSYKTAYVTFAGTGKSHVFVTTDAGQKWTDITNNLPKVSANALVIVPVTVNGVTTDDLYVATDVGIYLSTDSGQSWSRVGVGLPNVPVVDLQYNANFGTLAVATQGRGVFTLSTNTDGPNVSNLANGSATTTISSLNLTFNEPINPATLTLSTIKLTGPGNSTIAPTGIVNLDPTTDQSFQVTFAGHSSPGFYGLTLATSITDQVGNQMDQNQNGVNGENPGDIYTGRIFFEPGANHAPSLTSTTASFPSTNEDGVGGNNGTDLATWVGGLPITDSDTGAVKGVVITGIDDTNGTWQYSQNSGSTWTNIPTTVSNTSALALQAVSTNRMRFVPGLHYVGNATFTFQAWDLTAGLTQPGGTDGGLVDASTNGGSTAYSSATGTATINVLFANHPPSFTPGGDQTVLENAGAQTVTGWATNLSTGPSNESSQTLNFIVNNNNNNALFSTQPAVSSTGTLTYTPKANANGSATVTVTLHDNGGTANGGVDTSDSVTFVINVTPVNQPPSFTAGGNQSGTVNTGAQSVAWATNIVPGPSNESSQSVTFVVSNDNPSLFLAQPSISTNGTLTFQIGSTIGTANVTVFLKDTGGTANGGQDTYGPVTFTITASPIVTSGSADAVWISQVYRDLLKREISLSEVNFWTGALDSGESRLQVAQAITQSTEYRAVVIQSLFNSYLGRAADSGALTYFQSLFQQGATVEEVKAQILSSSEYYSKNGGTNFGFLVGVYRDVLSTTLDNTGRNVWGTMLSNGTSRHDVAVAIMKAVGPDGMDTALERLVQNTYPQLLHRGVDQSSLTYWVTNLQSGMRDEDFYAGVVTSPEYGFNATGRFYNSAPDQKWLSQVYLDTLGRAIDSVGSAYFIGQIRTGMRRPQVVANIFNSQEYRSDEVTAAFASIMHRAPDSPTVAYFVNYLNQGFTIEQVKAVMFGSPEYYAAQGGNTPEGFLEALYRDALGRTLDDNGRSVWGTALAVGQTNPSAINDPGSDLVRESAALGILTSGEAYQIVAAVGYQKFLRRSVDAGGLAYWVGQLSQGMTDEQFYAQLIGSKEYYVKFTS
jgi:hypothetical protein